MHQLSGAEAGLVRALIQLLAQGSPGFPWQFSHEGPFDALIINANSPDIRNPALRQTSKAVSALAEPGTVVPAELEVLERPLRAERLESWLVRVQQQLGAWPGSAPPRIDTPLVRYKLKRWPPAALLHGDAQRIRLATLLSRKPMDVSELTILSGQDHERCDTFINLLQGFGILDAFVPEAAPLGQAAPHRPAAHRGLIQSIRRRLGL